MEGHAQITSRVINRLKLKQLRLLIAVGRHRSILHAAREMNLSQPAATKMIKDLEIDFDVLLFERTNRGVIPTAAGDALIRGGQLIFSQLGTTAQELEDIAGGNAGRIVVGTLLAASARLLPLAIAQVLAQRPNLAIRVIEGTNEVLMPRLRAGELDLVVGRLPVLRHRSDLTQMPLGHGRIALVVREGHPLCGRAGLGFDDLRPYGWIVPPADTTLRRQMDQFFVTEGQYMPPLMVESVSFVTNRGLLLGSDMICAMPAEVAHAAEGGALAELPLAVPFGDGPVGASFRSNTSLPPAAAALLAALRDVAAQPSSASDRIG
ncbi:LysR family transcriptional regulator [Pelagivirga sediminicola]|uniref:LysR family transcriptional regulator n=1 Tax=Pelagivirga sediminicola TaxID=2170575 RepID=A0A2T7GAY7_9RHOB|nr:LysR family transcriptional regulator [Pelagivirga sediminicola]PVA11587.1 LysR family transcriptional regulator [Pelagivirga sediminicola]